MPFWKRRTPSPTEYTILVGDIPIEVTRKRIKHVHLRVHPPNGRVTMSAPMSIRRQVVEEFAATREDWIRRQQVRVRGQEREVPRRFESGESHYLWGQRRTLSVVERPGKAGVTLDESGITMFVKPDSEIARRADVLHEWHKSLLQAVLPGLIQTWEKKLNVRLTSYHLRRMKTRWGSCNRRTRQIRLNTELVTKPAHLLEYVVVHEMVHLIVPNHGPRFVALMDEHYPSWREARAELNKSGVWTA